MSPAGTRSAKPHVAIVGLMGAGKSTVGRRLARRLGLHFADTDDFITTAAGRSIPEIFSTEGEAGFRAREFEATRCALSGAPSVVSLGGGALTHGPTRALVARRAIRVYLEMRPKAIFFRLRRSRTVRPLIGETPALERIVELLQQREPLYREAEVHVNAEGSSPDAVAERIVERLAEYRFTAPQPAARA
jgi:shikimate kinase